MHLETPIRAGKNAAGKTPSPLSQKALGQGNASVGQNRVQRPKENAAQASNGHSTEREERLLRLVDILRTEQLSASTTEPAEVETTNLRRWRAPALLAVVIVVGAAATLYVIRSTHIFAGAPSDRPAQPAHVIQPDPAAKAALRPQPPDKTFNTASATSGPTSSNVTVPVPEAPAQSSQPLPAPNQQAISPSTPADAVSSPASSAAEPKLNVPPAPKQEAAEPDSASLAGTPSDVLGSKPNKPALAVYVPAGSLRAETNARNLATQINPDIATSNIETQASLPSDAVIKISEENNHKLARTIGKSLGDLGYRWKIENSSGTAAPHSNMIEVWLPR